MVDINNYIETIVSKEIDIPDQYTYKVNRTLNSLSSNKKRIPFKLIKECALVCSFVFIITGCVFSKEIITYIKYFFNTNSGMDKAISKGYLYEPETDYIESNGTSVAIKNILMDDYNLSLTFSMKIEDNINIAELSKIRVSELLITDEENRILYCEDEKVFTEFCNEKNLNYKYNESNENYINSGVEHYVKSKDDNNSLDLIYNFYGNKFPKSKKIYISFKQINMSKNDSIYNDDVILKGNWNVECDLPEKFYNREAITYTVKSCTKPDINVTEASLHNTGMRIVFNTTYDKWYDENASEEEKNRVMENFRKWRLNNMKYNDAKSMITDEYITTGNGQKFYPLNSSTEDQYIHYGVDGKFDYMQTFNLTAYDEYSDTLTLHLKVEIPNQNEEIIIELERKK